MSQFVAPFMIKITKQQQKTLPFDNNWFDFGGRDSFFIFLAVTCFWTSTTNMPHYPHSWKTCSKQKNLWFPSKKMNKTIGFFQWANIQIYIAVGNSTILDVSFANIICFVHPVFFFPSDAGLPRVSGWGCFWERCIRAWQRFVGSRDWSWVLAKRNEAPSQDASHHRIIIFFNRKSLFTFTSHCYWEGATPIKNSDGDAWFSEVLWFHTWVEKDIT